MKAKAILLLTTCCRHAKMPPMYCTAHAASAYAPLTGQACVYGVCQNMTYLFSFANLDSSTFLHCGRLKTVVWSRVFRKEKTSLRSENYERCLLLSPALKDNKLPTFLTFPFTPFWPLAFFRYASEASTVHLERKGREFSFFSLR